MDPEKENISITLISMAAFPSVAYTIYTKLTRHDPVLKEGAEEF